jgi:thiamine biosynthesis protein ThiS
MDGDSGESERIALALSGGGFRATLFHLGALLFLRDARILTRVTHVASVSGGSVTAAYVLAHWDRFIDERQHVEVVRSLVAFTQSDVIGRIYRLLINRTKRLEKFYELQLYPGLTLSSLRHEGLPRLYMMATNLTTGAPLAFSTEGLHLGSTINDGRPVAATVPVSRAVAASSAFPVLFGALELTRDELGMAGKRVAVEVNQEIVPRSRHLQFQLNDSDRVEVVFAIGGG